MPVARPDSGDTRVIAHLDLDCFYVQVEQRKRPELRGKPVAVVQYNQWKGGGLIAVSYEARKVCSTWLWNIARGKNGDEVQGRVLTKSHSCSRAFPGPTALTSMTSVMHWLGELSERLQDQLDLDLEMHNRKAKLLVFHAAVHLRGGSQPAKKFPSKSCPLRYGREKILADVRSLFERGLRDFCPLIKSLSPVKGSGSNSCNWAVTLISIGANDISALPLGVSPITSFFAAPTRSNPPEPREEVELGASSRTPSNNDLESLINNEGALQPCSSESLFRADDDTGSDVKCTPAFGSVRSPVRHQSHFQVPESEASVQNRCSRGEDLEPSLIRCSPIFERETSSAASLHSLQESPTSDATTSETKPKEPANLISPVHEPTHHHDPDPGTSSVVNLQSLQDSPRSAEVASRVVQLRLAFPPSKDGQTPPTSSGTRPASSSGLKLKDLWQRKRTASSISSLEWTYKQEDVDEEVLAQLPPEIQQELRSSLKLQRPPKRPSISDFFQSAAK